MTRERPEHDWSRSEGICRSRDHDENWDRDPLICSACGRCFWDADERCPGQRTPRAVENGRAGAGMVSGEIPEQGLSLSFSPHETPSPDLPGADLDTETERAEFMRDLLDVREAQAQAEDEERVASEEARK